MLFFRESAWLLLANGTLGFILGYFKGMPRVGFLLGLFLGPIGWGIAYLLPSQPRRNLFEATSFRRPGASDNFGHQGQPGQVRPSGPICPRCGKPVSKGDKACPGCGNVLIQVRYHVHGSEESGSR